MTQRNPFLHSAFSAGTKYASACPKEHQEGQGSAQGVPWKCAIPVIGAAATLCMQEWGIHLTLSIKKILSIVPEIRMCYFGWWMITDL